MRCLGLLVALLLSWAQCAWAQPGLNLGSTWAQPGLIRRWAHPWAHPWAHSWAHPIL